MEGPSSSALAFVTTVHIALGLLLNHRRAGPGRLSALALPSALLVPTPWVLSSPLWLVGVVTAHLAWLFACEKLVPEPPAPHPGRAPSARPAPAPAEPAAKPAGFTEVRVLAVLPETPEIRTFRLERPRGFSFTAGQFLMVRVDAGGEPRTRCYSISSAPHVPGYLEISVRRQGLVSGTLHEGLGPGSTVAVRGPGGHFVYPREAGAPIALLAAGVGITPLMSMLRHAAAAEPDRSVSLLYSARTEADIAYRTELSLLSARHPRLRIALALSRDPGRPGTLSGRIDAEMIRSVVADLGRTIFLICGPAPMIESSHEALASLGVSPDRIRYEAFEAAVASANAALAGTSAAEEGEYWLELRKTGKRVRVRAGASLLEAAEAAGSGIDSLCRGGSCGTCRTRLISGAVEARGDALDQEDRGAGYILPCTSWARGDCALDA